MKSKLVIDILTGVILIIATLLYSGVLSDQDWNKPNYYEILIPAFILIPCYWYFVTRRFK